MGDDRKQHHPEKIWVSRDALKKLNILRVDHDIPMSKMYGYAVEYAVRNWSRFENYVEAQEKNTNDSSSSTDV